MGEKTLSLPDCVPPKLQDSASSQKQPDIQICTPFLHLGDWKSFESLTDTSRLFLVQRRFSPTLLELATITRNVIRSSARRFESQGVPSTLCHKGR